MRISFQGGESYSRDFMMQIRDIEPVLDTSSFTYFSEHDFRIFENVIAPF